MFELILFQLEVRMKNLTHRRRLCAEQFHNFPSLRLP